MALTAREVALRKLAQGTTGPMDLSPPDEEIGAYLAEREPYAQPIAPAPRPTSLSAKDVALQRLSRGETGPMDLMPPEPVREVNPNAADMIPTLNPESGEIESMPSLAAERSGRVWVSPEEATSAFSSSRALAADDRGMERGLRAATRPVENEPIPMASTIDPETGEQVLMDEAEARALGRIIVPRGQATADFRTEQGSRRESAAQDAALFAGTRLLPNDPRLAAPKPVPAAPRAARAAPPMAERSMRASVPEPTQLPIPEDVRSRVTAAPAASPAPVPDEFAAAQDAARQRRMFAGLGQAADFIGASIAGTKPQGEFYQGLAKDADIPVRDYLAAKQQREQGARAEYEATLKDPNSEQSKRFQAYISRTFPGVYAPEDVALMSASDAEQVTNLAQMRATLNARKEEQSARATAEAAENEAQRAFQAGESQKQRALQRELNAQRADTRETPEEREQRRIDAENRKRQQVLSERNVGGYEFDPANPPSADASKQMANATIQKAEIDQSLAILERLYRKGGTTITGEDAGVMESEWINITNRLRVLNDMGVPNGADYAMLGKQLEDPTTLRNLTTSKDRGLAQMGALRSQVQRKMDATAQAYKFRPVGQPQRAPAPTDASGRMDLGGQQVQMRAPDGSVGMVDAAEVEEAERNKYVRL